MATPAERVALRATASHVAMAAHALALATTVLILVWSIHFRGGIAINSDNEDLIINAHPVIMFMGFILVSGEAIMEYNTVMAPKKVQKMVHMLLQLVALFMGIFGVYVAFKFHGKSSLADLYSLHSWLGIITICLFALQWLVGFLLFWWPGAPLPTRAVVAPWHAFLGLGVFLMAICTAQTGLTQKIEGPGAESVLINFTALGVLLFGITVSFSAILPKLLKSIQTSIV